MTDPWKHGQQNPAYYFIHRFPISRGRTGRNTLRPRNKQMSDYTQLIKKSRIHWFLLALPLGLSGYYFFQFTSLRTEAVPTRSSQQVFAWPANEEPPAELWNVFAPAAGASLSAEASGPMGQRFRLAGTFFSYADPMGTSQKPESRAIIDDLQNKQQHLVRENDLFEGVRVVHIYRDRVAVEFQGRTEELWLSYAGGPSSAKTAASGDSNQLAQADADALETTRFGKRIGENRWVFQRDGLLKYYQELLDDPERMAAIFLSMKPDYQQGRIAGYHVDMEGEKDFFREVGLQQGDIVRKVNSMRMTSQARAEYFLGEFMKNRMSAVVMEIDRDGKSQKLIYLLR
jgi:type II secretion system protein C